ncbi:hypothetical protein M0R45_016876 [Rubus argutus]|uniref:Uncharacterized protein n=1 Tax=Rubus argutus TaxID=59490 RepID=A0AAW1XTV5_RUBAR
MRRGSNIIMSTSSSTTTSTRGIQISKNNHGWSLSVDESDYPSLKNFGIGVYLVSLNAVVDVSTTCQPNSNKIRCRSQRLEIVTDCVFKWNLGNECETKTRESVLGCLGTSHFASGI